jgi:lipopolysaccharide biosynthesis glycosyltransferase
MQHGVALVCALLTLSLFFAQGGAAVALGAIRVAVAVDHRSFKDFLILVHSAYNAALHPENVHLHVVACGKTLEEAKRVEKMVVSILTACVPRANSRLLHIVPFTLPPSSGFAKQLVSVVQKSHWYSPTGADMARFFLAELFPDAQRLLYLDNDVVVTCCLEEIFYTPFDKGEVAGIALDDLKWATSTQFHRHYNRSHELVKKNVRRGAVAGARGRTGDVTEDEFQKKLSGKYPNDGVLLIDVQQWRKQRILPLMEEIAAANGRGESVVSLGTQQFTVLALFDRWKELTPRANLRHFPDMARGFLMWYLYNGLVHFAGQSKPQHVCDANSALDHRINTYHSWAFNVDALARHEACGKIMPNNTRRCGEAHIPRVETFAGFLDLSGRVFEKNKDDGALLFLRLGRLLNWGVGLGVGAGAGEGERRGAGKGGDMVAAFDLHVLRNSTWSWRVFPGEAQPQAKQQQEGLLDRLAPRGKWRGKCGFKVVTGKAVCDGTDPLDEATGGVLQRGGGLPLVNKGGNLEPTGAPCLSVLASIKGEEGKPKKAHWDVMAISVDVLPSETRLHSSSLGALLSLQLEFMRPKLILARLYARDQVPVALRFLQRHGYKAFEEGKSRVVFAYRVNALEL